MELPDDWMRKIEVEQAEVLTLLRGLSEKMDDRISSDDKWRQKVDRILIGDGNGHVGHNVRLDRLEQAHDRQKRFFWGLLVPVCLLALKAISDFLGA